MAGRIIFADEMATNRILLRARLGAAAYTALQAGTGAEVLALASNQAPDLVVLSDSIGDMNALDLCRRLKAQPGSCPLPLILLSDDTSRQARLAALEAGADAILPRQPDDGILRARIRNLLRRRAGDQELARGGVADGPFALVEPARPAFALPGQIALIAPTLAEGLKWRNGLATRLRDRIAVIDPAHALAELDREPAPDAVVIAGRPSKPDEAMQILADLRCRSETLRSAVVLVQPEPDRAGAIAALDLGVCDLVDSGFDAGEMACLLRRELARKAHNDSRRAALHDGMRMAVTDPLTGLYNRRYAMSQLSRILAAAPENGERFAVLAMDLDLFKQVNDRYGHAAGDAVLTETARRLNSCLRREDFLARIGGEEFLAVIRTCDTEAAARAAERLRRVVADTAFDLPGGKGTCRVTLSIGLVIAGGKDAKPDPAALIDTADRGLYSAKAEGRNQVSVCRTAA